MRRYEDKAVWFLSLFPMGSTLDTMTVAITVTRRYGGHPWKART